MRNKLAKGGAALTAAILAVGLASVGQTANAAPAVGGPTSFVLAGTWQDGWSGKTSWYKGATATATVRIDNGGGNVELASYTGTNVGIAGVAIDSGAQVNADQYRTTNADRVWFTSPALAPGCHTVRVTALASKRSASSGTTITVREVRTSNGAIIPPGQTCVPPTAPPTTTTPAPTTTAPPTTTTQPPPPTTTTPPPPPAEGGAATIAGLTLPAPGWFSGSSGAGDFDGSFGAWRGQATTEVSTWHDQPNGTSWSWGPGQDKVKYKGWLDIAPGGADNWAAAAGGSLDAQWRDYLVRLRAARTIDGVLYPTSLRPAHELNGTWYSWSVNGSEVNDFRATMRRWESIADQAFPEAMFELCFNGETTEPTLDAAQLYEPGVWDLIGVDRYNQYPYVGTQRNGTFTSFQDASLRGTDADPIGAERWRLFAESRGLPLVFPEYANSAATAEGGDDAYYVREWFAWVNANAGKSAGDVLMESWFNIAPGEYNDNFWLRTPTATNAKQPNVVTAYQNQFPMS